ncbi:unnamed protein product [Pleuronectes platessa]|uniref:Uncharacterized protein n=1 Tax=Pleuronectes platessa TaxID=8262 RepID=A0A9N7YHN1_PLEPL|nr:unnamed protein product [Pleuronectes platessa]
MKLSMKSEVKQAGGDEEHPESRIQSPESRVQSPESDPRDDIVLSLFWGRGPPRQQSRVGRACCCCWNTWSGVEGADWELWDDVLSKSSMFEKHFMLLARSGCNIPSSHVTSSRLRSKLTNRLCCRTQFRLSDTPRTLCHVGCDGKKKKKNNQLSKKSAFLRRSPSEPAGGGGGGGRGGGRGGSSGFLGSVPVGSSRGM